MKYHIAVKFLAIFLCAACLLGAVGSGAGMVILSELNLYNNTVEEVLEKEIRDSGQRFARSAALYYASEELGGCPEELVSEHYDNQWYNSYYAPGDYGYLIRDAEGNVVAGSNADLAETGKCYSFPVTGQYMHLVSATPVSQEADDTREDQETQWEYGVYDALPASGEVEVYDITVEGCNEVDGEDASSSGYGSASPIGVLYHQDNTVVFQCLDDLPTVGELFYLKYVRHVAFRNSAGNVIYEASDPMEIGGDFRYGDGLYVFKPRAQASQGQLTSVYRADFYSLEDPNKIVFQVYGNEAIGEMYEDQNGEPVFNVHSILDGQVSTSGSIASGWVSGVCLFDQEGELIRESRNPGLVTLTEDGLIYYHTAAGDVTVPTPSAEAAAAETPPAEDQAPEAEPEGEPEEPVQDQPDGEAPEQQPEENPEDNPEEGASEEPQADWEEPEADAEALSEDGQEAPEEGEQAEPEEIEATEVTEAPIPLETAASETVPPTLPEETEPAFHYEMVAVTEPVTINGKPLTDYEINSATYYDQSAMEPMRAQYVYMPMPDYTVELYVTEGTLIYEAAYTLLGILRNFRSDLFLLLGGSLLLFAVCVVYLCCAAGHKPKQEEIKAGGLCRMPLDLNLALSAAAVTGLVFCAIYGAQHLLMASIETGALTVAGTGYLTSLCVVQLLYCAVSQFKTPGHYWWRNSLCGRILLGCWKSLKWMVAFLPEKLVRIGKFLWNLLLRILRFLWRDVLVKAASGIGGLIRKFMGLLPLIWQWLLAGLVIVLLCGITANTAGILFAIPICLALVLYGAYCFGVLMKSAKRMGKGDLNTKVEDKYMVGCFEEFAGDLNDLAGVAVVAAQKQLKSERMKTELITNVSHDIKTPLTSIINYVDLLQKPHTEEEEAMYLDVLARQSQRLKKLIEDLMDMSKASTGNMNVDITTLDAVEAINQALGEFADKLESAELIPVFRHSKDTVPMRGDGKLVWRVLSNLLGNAVKYAMPGTRLYLDLVEMEGNVIISMKNISREELNVDSEELMERFVRGDDSRNTEGSGLGLNIAKSLMELQKGQLQLLVDGDLFKVTLIFPGA